VCKRGIEVLGLKKKKPTENSVGYNLGGDAGSPLSLFFKIISMGNCQLVGSIQTLSATQAQPPVSLF
jgi:hypothetical protein